MGIENGVVLRFRAKQVDSAGFHGIYALLVLPRRVVNTNISEMYKAFLDISSSALQNFVPFWKGNIIVRDRILFVGRFFFLHQTSTSRQKYSNREAFNWFILHIT